LITSHTNSWTSQNVRLRNKESPSLTGDYSILQYADDIKNNLNVVGSKFEYRLEAQSRGWFDIYIYIFIKYLRYNARSDWSKVCKRSVYIRGQRFSARACTFHRFKIFYKINIKRSIVSIYCDINTLRGKFLWLPSCSTTPIVFYISQHIDMRGRFIFLKYIFIIPIARISLHKARV
jgi:hypothetical protein